jgi:hypothetical protein
LTIAAVIVAIVEPFACRGECESAGADQSRNATGTIFERIIESESAAEMTAAQRFIGTA